MNSFITIIIPVAALAASLSGCISHIGVKKVAPGTNPDGLRVHLPAPFIVGKPNANNKIEYTVEYLPDPDQEYAITAWSLMAKNKVDVTRMKSMLLSKVEYNMDTGAVAKTALDEASPVLAKAVEQYQTEKAKDAAAKVTAAAAKTAEQVAAEAELDGAVTAAVAEATAAKAAEKAAKTAVNDANRTLKEENAALLTAKAAFDAATAADKPAKNEALVKAKNAVEIAQEGVVSANKALEDATKRVAAASAATKVAAAAKAANMNAVTEGAAAPVIVTKTPGPVVYRIVEGKDGGSLRLEQVNFKLFSMNGKVLLDQGKQLKRPTWGKTEPAK